MGMKMKPFCKQYILQFQTVNCVKYKKPEFFPEYPPGDFPIKTL